MGGDPKGEAFFPITSFFNANLVKVYPFGKAAQQIAEEFKKFKNQVAPPMKTMLEAAELAYEESNNQEIILLSPGCASFDEFKNFEERGKIFKIWAQTKV
ncbi:MAG: hypothetical protein K2X39_04765 [Silvanigrellaceae bacterium]|nr:hypothetical protein [Silvanigrellaceae bacterium]